MGKGGLAENIASHVLRRRKRLSFFFKLAAVHKFGCCVVSLLIAQFPADPSGGEGEITDRGIATTRVAFTPIMNTRPKQMYNNCIVTFLR